MDLCYEDVKTFDDYPEWKGRLEQVYKRKDFIAGYTSIQSVMSKCSAGAPLAVYDHAISARKLYERGDLDEAQDRLATTGKEYREFISRKITGFIHDCDSLFAFSSVRPESLQRCKNGLARLMDRVDEPAWPQADFADQYNRYSQQITDKKNAVREQLIQQASDLRKNIIDSSNKAQQASFFWKSRLIGKYIAAAQQYDTDDVEGSIANWRYVENLNRLSSITNQMDNLNYRLAGMLTRKDQLDGLAGDIDEAVSFCERFKGVSDVERKKYNQWGLELKQLKSALSASTNNTRLIDQRDEIFAAEYSSIRSGFLEIRAQLPYHRSRVIELIKKSDYLKSNADSINKMQQHWTDVLPDLNVSLIKPNLTEARDYLEKVKDEVDKWSPDSFNRRMQDKCETLAGAIKEQSLAVLGVISAVLVEKDRLIDGIDSFDKKTAEVLADSDIRTLDDLAATDTRDALLRFRQLPDLLRTNRQRLVALGVDTGPVSANIITDTSPVGFELDTWLQKFNMEKDNLDAQIVQLRTIQDTTALFQEVQRILSQQSLMETDYYLGLRDCAVGLIDYSDISNRINAVETNSDSVKMCDFLEQMHNDTVPRLTDLKATVVSISEELASLKHSQIDTLSKAKGFNRDRERLLDHISALQQDVAKLSMANLENNCKESVAHSANEIMDLIGDTGQNDVLIRVTSSLWQFFPDHSNWSEWGPFLQLFHVAVSEEGMRLTCSDLLIPVNEEGSYLDPAGISGNIAKAFHLTVGESANFGWPRYVSHRKDPTVILAFIPGMQSVGVRPFYMATREINNTQYKLFLEENGAISTTKLAGWSYFADHYDKLLICQAQGQYPPCRISWDESTGFIITGVESRHAPVTWVTSDGAQAYAEWLGSRLPTASQHTFAARAGAGTVYPWGDDLSHITSYAHVRSATWQEAAREYNSKRDNPVEIAYPPVGAVKDFLRGKAIDPAKTVHAESVNYSVWPCSTKDTKPNLWGLYDMIGNVWEWCRDKPEGSAYVICGGSCLSPPEYTRSDSKYEFNAQACDVGFRVVMPVQ
jgi:formylglycine-generating enzyme required for sulfatase activity